MSEIIKQAEEVLKASKELYDLIKQLVAALSEQDNEGAFIQVCLAVKEWEEMDLHLEYVLDALKDV